MDKLSCWKLMCAVLLVAPLVGADLQHAKSLYEQKKYQQAAQELKPLVEETPALREARYYLALSLIELNRFDEAQVQLDAIADAEESAPGKADMNVARARISLARKNYAAAVPPLNEAIEHNPDHVQARMLRAETELHQKNYKTVVEDAERVIALEPDKAYAYYYAGIAYSNLGRPDKMADYFMNFLKLAPDAPEAPKIQSLLKSLRR